MFPEVLGLSKDVSNSKFGNTEVKIFLYDVKYLRKETLPE